MTDHPITPPPELVRHWSRFQGDTNAEALWFRIANEAAQWGADQELEACCEWLAVAWKSYAAVELRAARRPKPEPPSKEEALDELYISFDRGYLKKEAADIIRRALEALPD
jgi:DNA-directed RNA polymerase specialized sigma24 family protein